MKLKKIFFITLSLMIYTSYILSFEAFFRETTECTKIMALSVATAVTYGIVNDQVTARICPEYFTKGFHQTMLLNMSKGPIRQMLLSTKSPTILAFIWGTIATWWMGALLGIPVTASARIGSFPKLDYKDLIKPACIGMAGMFTASFLAGLNGYFYAKNETPETLKHKYHEVAWNVPEDAIKGWVVDACAHSAAYASGTFVGLGLACYTLWKRYSLRNI